MAGDPDTDIEARVAQLSTLGLDGLRARWRSEVGRTAPSHLSKHLLLRLLAYRLQAQAFGDLTLATQRLLDGLAKQKKPAGGGGMAVPLPDQGRLIPGSVLVREHEGQQHHVTVAEDGFVWNGHTYASLSTVAFAITGTKWNGPRFFGLRSNGTERQA